MVVAAAIVARYALKDDKATIHYETMAVERGNVVAKVTATGTVSATVTVQVGSQVSGRLQAIFVDYNAPVTKGMLLAKLDPQMFQAALAQANASLTAARGSNAKAMANATNTRLQFERAQELAAKNMIAQADVDSARASMLTAQADVQSTLGQIAQASANVKQATINLNYTDILSPVDGTVISRNVDVGQTVAASLQAPVLFTIAEDLRKMQVDTSVSEADVGKLEPNMAATFTVDAYPGMPFKGTVRQIRNAPVTVQNVVTYDAVIDVANPELKLKPGMTATVTFIYADRSNVLRVSNASLRFKPPTEALGSAEAEGSARGRRGGANGGGMGGPNPAHSGGGRGRFGEKDPSRKVVWVLRDQTRLERVVLKTGVSDGTNTEVLEGSLNEGDQVVTGSTVSGGASKSTPKASPASTAGMRRIL